MRVCESVAVRDTIGGMFWVRERSKGEKFLGDVRNDGRWMLVAENLG